MWSYRSSGDESKQKPKVVCASQSCHNEVIVFVTGNSQL